MVRAQLFHAQGYGKYETLYYHQSSHTGQSREKYQDVTQAGSRLDGLPRRRITSLILQFFNQRKLWRSSAVREIGKSVTNDHASQSITVFRCLQVEEKKCIKYSLNGVPISDLERGKRNLARIWSEYPLSSQHGMTKRKRHPDYNWIQFPQERLWFMK